MHNRIHIFFYLKNFYGFRKIYNSIICSLISTNNYFILIYRKIQFDYIIFRKVLFKMGIVKTTLLMMALLCCVFSQIYSSNQLIDQVRGDVSNSFNNNPMMNNRECLIKKPQSQCKQSADLIVNGGFEQNLCTHPWCGWNKSNFDQKFVPGWIPQPEIEIGKAQIYTNVLGHSWVSQLDNNANNCISQKVLNTKRAKYTLQFDWAARQGIAFRSCDFTVAINNQVKLIPKVNDYARHHEKVDFYLDCSHAETWITFCGSGVSDGYGAVIDNVSLTYQDCQY